jgi:pimeloyl-ACP methyl ester carboxylesterase
MMTGDKVSPAMMRSGEYKNHLAKISPHALVTKTTVPSLIGYGPYDKLVPIKTGRALIRALEENGVTHDYVEFSNSGHGLNRDPDKAALFVQLIERYLQRYLPLPH